MTRILMLIASACVMSRLVKKYSKWFAELLMRNLNF